jgi:hypothetical protein
MDHRGLAIDTSTGTLAIAPIHSLGLQPPSRSSTHSRSAADQCCFHLRGEPPTVLSLGGGPPQASAHRPANPLRRYPSADPIVPGQQD